MKERQMGIRMQDLASTDFSDVIARPRKRLTVTHPGQFLLDEFMEPHGLSANALATALHVPANRITAILKGQRAVGPTVDKARRRPTFHPRCPLRIAVM